MREVLFVAGETSGDLHAAGVAAELGARVPDLALTGIGGSRMAAAGVSLIEHTDRLAVMGFAEVVRHIPRHYRLLSEIRARLAGGRVGLVVLVDYPGFNMKVASAARRAGVPVLYYITPQVWAWGAGRLATMAATVTRAAVILPFEEALLREHGIDATFVGHPLLDHVGTMPSREQARCELGIPLDVPVLALFPGSRAQEIARHLDRFVETARELERRVPGLHVIVSAAPGITIDEARCPYPLVRAASFTVWRAADAALSKSGTSTLEAAVAGCPLVVGYRASAVTYAIARRVVTIPSIGLVNVVAGRQVAPEFIQHALEPQRVADALEPLLDGGSAERCAMLTGLAEVRAKLGSAGAAGRVAEIAAGLVR
ncbi:MAG TPA: lipid-A-disaccharide synthase [Gemmatimonadaceae bacterium]|nr:lipid-A-disaccharide synthase [Gemmatimonadaceae bacterium]